MVRGDGRARGYASRGTWAVGAALLTALITATAWAASVTYVYDEAGRLKQVLYDDGAQVSYKLDAAGNRTQVTSAAATPVNAPTGLTAQPASDNSVALSWTAATGGTGQFTYYLYRNGTQLPQSITTTSTTDAGLAPNTSYSYTVSAVDSDGSPTPQTSSVSATTYAIPVIASFTGTQASSSQINLSWSASDAHGPGLTGFKLYRGGSIIGAFAAATTSYTDTGLSPGTSYSYQLSTTDSAGDIVTANTSVSTYPPPVISGLTVTSASSTSMILTWSGSDTGGPGGLIYSVARGSTPLSCTTSPCTDSGLAAGTQYSYTVTASDSAGDQSNASGSQYTVPSAPGAIAVSSVSTTTATISWAAAAGTVTNYQYSLNGGATWSSTGTALSASIAGLSSGTTYTVLVNAGNAGGVGSNNSASFQTVVGAPTLSETGSGVACPSDFINWTSVTGATSYQLWSREYTPSLDSSYNEIYTGTALSLHITLPKGYGYYYQAAACNANGCGAFSNVITVREGTCP